MSDQKSREHHLNKVDFQIPIGAPASSLRTYIMLALGWKVESYTFEAFEGVPDYTCWRTTDPDGTVVGQMRLYNSADAYDLVPNWPARLEDALTLIPYVEHAGYRCAMFLGASGLWCCEFLPDIGKPISKISGHDRRSIPEAISMAFIVWHASRVGGQFSE